MPPSRSTTAGKSTAATVGVSHRRGVRKGLGDDAPGVGADDKDANNEREAPQAKDPEAPVVNISITPGMKNKKAHTKSAESAVNKHWGKFKKGRRGRPFSVLPFNPYSENATPQSYGTTRPIKATEGFDDAVKACKAKVEKISKECRRINQKYRDYHFDLQMDILWQPEPEPDPVPPPPPKEGEPLPPPPPAPKGPPPRYCLDGLDYNWSLDPKSVRRIEDIFSKPEFFKDGVGYNDVRQGHNGDCWFLAAVATVTCVPNLIERVCVARDEEVGIYGFVFYRDGEWISSIVDDQLYLTAFDYYDADKFQIYSSFKGLSKESVYQEALLRGSDALYFGSCVDSNETWLPLLEKAYAKAHGDYSAIEGGWTGEGVEDLTGGVTVEIATNDILSKDKFWKEQLTKVNQEFLFAGAFESGVSFWGGEKDGVIGNHAYSVLKAVEVDGERLVLVRNPWGESEWRGPWSDGSKEWTADWVRKLDHKFGDDGVFWMSYKDFLRIFTTIDRTRLFDDDWSVTSAWIRESVEWENTYSQSRFQIDVPEKCMVVIVLQQLDTRYFKGLEGEYYFSLHFRLHNVESSPAEYILRSRANVGMTRSCSAECELEKGKYDVVFKIHAERNGQKPVESAVEQVSLDARKKFLWLGMSYDLAHAKGAPPEKDEKAKEEKKDEEKKDEEKKDEKKEDEKKDEKKEEAKDEKKEGAEDEKKDDVKEKKKDGEEKSDEEKNEETAAKKDEEAQTDDTDKKAEKAEAKSDKKDEKVDEAPKSETKTEEKKADEETPNADATKEDEKKETSTDEKTDAAKDEKTDASTSTDEDKKDEKADATEKKEEKDVKDTEKDEKDVKDDAKKDEKAADLEKETQELRDVILKKYPDWLLTVPAVDILDMQARLKAYESKLKEATKPAAPTAPGASGDPDDEPIVIPGGPMPKAPFPPPPPGIRPLPPSLFAKGDSDDEEDENNDAAFEENCWNAVAVVGLRVYSYKQKVTIEVIRPQEEAPAKGGDKKEEEENDGEDKSKPLQLKKRPTEKFKLSRKPTLAVPLDPDEAVEDVGKDQKKDKSEEKDAKEAEGDSNIKTGSRDDSFMEEKRTVTGEKEQKEGDENKDGENKEEKKEDEQKQDEPKADDKKDDDKKDDDKKDDDKKDDAKKDEGTQSDDLNREAVVV